MKKFFLSAIAVMALGTAAQAQEMKFGVKAGVNLASLSADEGETSSRTGLHIGAVAEFKLTETFAIQPELLYSMQGAEFESELGDAETKLDYLNIPVLAKYYVMEGLSIEAGPQVGFLMSAKEGDEDAKDFYKSVDFGIAAGLAYDLDMGVFFQARYYVGLSDINDVPDEFEEVMGESSTNHNVFSVSVGYKF